MRWVGRTTSIIMALLLIFLGVFLVMVDEDPDGPLQPETEAEEPRESVWDASWWSGIVSIGLGLVVLGVTWRRSGSEEPPEG